MQMTAQQSKMAGQLVELIASRLGNERAVHAETAIACAARLSGSLLLCSFDLDLEDMLPGSAVLSDNANDKGPQLISILAAALHAMKVPLNPALLKGTEDARGAQPRLTILQTSELLLRDAMQIARTLDLSLEQAAYAAAVTAAFMVRECAKSIGAETGFNVAAYGFIEGSKTVPARVVPLAGPVSDP
jgi:hypothetical protein